MNRNRWVVLALTMIGVCVLGEEGFGLGLKTSQFESPVTPLDKINRIVSLVQRRGAASLLSPVNQNVDIHRAQQAGPYAEAFRSNRQPFSILSGNQAGVKLEWKNNFEAGAWVKGSYIGRWGLPIIVTVAIGATIYFVFISRGR